MMKNQLFFILATSFLIANNPARNEYNGTSSEVIKLESRIPLGYTSSQLLSNYGPTEMEHSRCAMPE